ncbi:MAG TPA: hypothetical protein PK055_08175 [Gammaproteobacteria bacterium]|nr:hypothetical protein [Xanthomonadales bacterium]MCB1594188.1 hypothetical protein [Xanthomonadales bacterium]HOP22498.1 hypothetical protein [Gammaproteobacteria bacterium]HPI96166.1 hypothetical protein [Gammaproteobacteria bacterium]HPQ87620.1 hypothetical protein [Gammaproteobacteria bacterium]
MKILHALKYFKYKKYDPSWLVDASKSYIDEYPWLPDAISKCTLALEGKNYIRFVSSIRPNKPSSEWQFRENIILEDTIEGDVILDILHGDRIGGVEFYIRRFKK